MFDSNPASAASYARARSAACSQLAAAIAMKRLPVPENRAKVDSRAHFVARRGLLAQIWTNIGLIGVAQRDETRYGSCCASSPDNFRFVLEINIL